MTAPRQYRAGQSVEDYCRQCHEDRIHTVIVVDAHAQPLRVACDFCRSEHNFRGGPRSAPRAMGSNPRATEGAESSEPRATEGAESSEARATEGTESSEPKATEGTESSDLKPPTPRVSAQRQSTAMMQTPPDRDLESMIRRIIREETGLTAVAPAEKWRGGNLVIRPGK